MADVGGHSHDDIRTPEDGDGQNVWDAFAAAMIANHAGPWTSDAGVVTLGPTGVELQVRVENIGDAGASKSAALFFNVRGPAVGAPAFASFSGYGPSPAAAVVEGCCMWSQMFAPVLLAGYGGAAASATIADRPELQDMERFAIDVEGRRFTVVSGSLGRVMARGGDTEIGERLTETRERLCAGAPSLTAAVLSRGSLPALSPHRATLLSTLAFDFDQGRTIEVKVDGGDWPAAQDAFEGIGPQPSQSMVLLRDLAVVTPAHPSTAPPGREDLKRTLSGLSRRGGRAGSAESWPGWAAHGGRLGLPASVPAELGGVPEEYVTLLQAVGVGGASPGYGLEAPRLVQQMVPLAFAGCGSAWILRLDPDHRGEVWYDASGSDETTGFVAPDALTWYEMWLDAAIRNRAPWVQWDTRACAGSNMLSRVLADHQEERARGDLSSMFGPGSVALSGASPFQPDQSGPGDPCQGCVATFANWNLGPDVFAPGVLAQRPTPLTMSEPPEESGRRRRFRRR